VNVSKYPQPDSCLSVTEVKELADDVIRQLLLPEIEGPSLDSGEIWVTVTLAAVNQPSISSAVENRDCESETTYRR